MNNEFYVITMQTKNDKTLYLKEKDTNNDIILCEWGFDYNNAIWFDTIDSLEKFAKSYFKNFNKWGIKVVYYSI